MWPIWAIVCPADHARRSSKPRRHAAGCGRRARADVRRARAAISRGNTSECNFGVRTRGWHSGRASEGRRASTGHATGVRCSAGLCLLSGASSWKIKKCTFSRRPPPAATARPHQGRLRCRCPWSCTQSAKPHVQLTARTRGARALVRPIDSPPPAPSRAAQVGCFFLTVFDLWN